jgi:hypothetical protein
VAREREAKLAHEQERERERERERKEREQAWQQIRQAQEQQEQAQHAREQMLLQDEREREKTAIAAAAASVSKLEHMLCYGVRQQQQALSNYRQRRLITLATESWEEDELVKDVEACIELQQQARDATILCSVGLSSALAMLRVDRINDLRASPAVSDKAHALELERLAQHHSIIFMHINASHSAERLHQAELIEQLSTRLIAANSKYQLAANGNPSQARNVIHNGVDAGDGVHGDVIDGAAQSASLGLSVGRVSNIIDSLRQVHTYTYNRAHASARTHTHNRACARARTQSHTHTHTHTHTVPAGAGSRPCTVDFSVLPSGTCNH